VLTCIQTAEYSLKKNGKEHMNPDGMLSISKTVIHLNKGLREYTTTFWIREKLRFGEDINAKEYPVTDIIFTNHSSNQTNTKILNIKVHVINTFSLLQFVVLNLSDQSFVAYGKTLKNILNGENNGQ